MRKKNKIILILILLAGISARLYSIKEGVFITDEGYTLKNCPIPMISLIKYWFSVGHFPTYFIMMHYWMKMFGIAIISMRFLSLVFGVLSIYAIFILGRKLFDEDTGLLAGFILAANSLNVYYSQCARPYSMVEFFVIMSFIFLYGALEKNTRLYWTGYIFFTLFTLFLSASALPVIICQIVFIRLLWQRYKSTIDIKKLIFSFSLIAFIYTPFLACLGVLSFKNDKVAPLDWLESPSLRSILDTFNLFGGTMYIDDSSHMPTQAFLPVLVSVFGIILFLLCLRGVFSLYKGGKEDRAKAAYLSIWLVGPIALFFVFSQLVSPVFGPIRFVLYASAAYYLLIARGIMSFKKKARLSIIISLIILSGIFLKDYYNIKYEKHKMATLSAWEYMRPYIKAYVKKARKSAKINNVIIVISYHNRADSFDRLFDYVNGLYLSLPVRGVWSAELLKKADYQEMAIKVITGKGIPENKRSRVDSIVNSIGITELHRLDCDRFLFIGRNTPADLDVAGFFKKKYDLIKEKKVHGKIIYFFKR